LICWIQQYKKEPNDFILAGRLFFILHVQPCEGSHKEGGQAKPSQDYETISSTKFSLPQ